MEQCTWKEVLDELSLYIEENYKGARLSAFSGANIAPTAKAKHAEPSIKYAASNAPKVAEDDDADLFCDIIKIFSKQSFCEDTAKATIPEALETFEDAETFSEALLRIIKEKDLIEADVYNRVFMDRKLFNKIRNDREYQPSKRTALLLSIALRLSVPETQEFLEKAGFALTHTSKTDIIIEFFMLRGNYDVIEINAALCEYRLPPLNK